MMRKDGTPLNWYDEAALKHRVLRLGDSGPQVELLQRALSAAGHRLVPDGQFGPATERALRAFQRGADLVADGVAGPKTLAALDSVDTSHLLHHSDIVRAAARLDVPVAAVMAVNEVESRGAGFLPDGRPAILFERHIMRRELLARGHEVSVLEDQCPGLVSPRMGGYKGGAREHDRLDRAREIEPDAAICACSWGLFQIMGMHWSHLDYASPTDYEKAMRRSEGDQLDAFVRFIEADPRLHQALRFLRWNTFARIYNGPAYAAHNYHGRMADAYDRHTKALEAIR